MKFLLIFSLLIGTAFANDPYYEVKCYEKDGQEMELAWVIGQNGVTKLFECNDKNYPDCEFRGLLKREVNQDSTCLELKRLPTSSDATAADNFNWELCHERQETLEENPRRLVPVSIESQNQERDAWCERGIIKVLYGRGPV